MSFRVDTHSDVPPSRQLAEKMLDALAAGHFNAGDRLPSVRALAAEALVNPNTVQKAYRELVALGVAMGRNGSGVYVTDAGPLIARQRRGEDTMEGFRKAVLDALAAGHGPSELLGELGGLLENRRGTGTAIDDTPQTVKGR